MSRHPSLFDHRRWMVRATPLLGLAWSFVVSAQETPTEPPAEAPSAEVPPVAPPEEPGQRPPQVKGAAKITLNYQNRSLSDLVKYFAELTGKNLLLQDGQGLTETITIISHKPMTVSEAYEAFLQALELNGYAPVTVGSLTRIVRVDTISQAPIAIGNGEVIASGTTFVTQIVPLENVAVNDVQPVVLALASPQAKMIAYAPSNTLIITDNATSLKRVMKILEQLDVAAPKSRMEIIRLEYAKASEVKAIIDDLYGTATTDARTRRATEDERPRTRRRREEEAPVPDTASSAISAGSEVKYINKVMADERTNSLIILANDQGLDAIKKLIAEVDVNVDPTSRSQIHVVYLEHAKAEEVATVLGNLSNSSNSSTTTRRRTTRTTDSATTNPASPAAARANAAEDGESSNVAAVFDSGMRITHDESTNSLVIIASNDDFQVVSEVIEKLDVKRRQVLIDAVILELADNESIDSGIGIHGPFSPTEGATGIVSGQFGASSLQLTQDLLTGLAIGVFGQSIELPLGGELGSLEIPAFGVVLRAIQSDASVDIVSNPQLLMLDNEEGMIKVGRKVPFPGPTQIIPNSGIATTSFQREDVDTELKVTPRVNSSNHVTLEVNVKVAELEDAPDYNASDTGKITSNREVDTTVMVADNQTVVLGGLVGTTETRGEKKVPILGDLPLIGRLFRSKTVEQRKTNLMIFLTPHIIDDEGDMVEIMQVKEAQRQEFIRRFRGKSATERMTEIESLLKYSMNFSGRDSVYSTKPTKDAPIPDAMPASNLEDEARGALEEVLSRDPEIAPNESTPASTPQEP